MRVRVVGVHADAAAVNGDSERDVTSVVGLEEALVIKYVPTHTCVDDIGCRELGDGELR